MNDPVDLSGSETSVEHSSSSSCITSGYSRMTGMCTKLVARATPVVQAARKTPEAQELFDAGGEVWAALAACIYALWALVEPAFASLVYDTASATRARRCAATGAEAFAWNAADNIYDVADAAIHVVYCKVDANGGLPARIAHGARDVLFWLIESGSSNTDTTIDQAPARAAAVAAVRTQSAEFAAAPRAALCAASKSPEGKRLKSATYAAFLAVLNCFMALGEAVLPIAESYVARGAAAVGARSSTAAGAEAFVLVLFYRFCAFVERAVSSLETFAKQYTGPCNLTLLQIATALAIFVSWIKDVANEESVTSATDTNTTTVTAPKHEHKQERWPIVEEPKDDDEDDEAKVVAKAEVISSEAIMAQMGGRAQVPRPKLE